MSGKLRLALALLIALFAARLLHEAATESFTIDEPGYVGTGLQLWHTGDYHFARVLSFHPPLAFHLASVPLVPGLPLPLFPGHVRGQRRVMLIPDTGGSFSIVVPRREAGRLGVGVIPDTRETDGEPWTRYGAPSEWPSPDSARWRWRWASGGLASRRSSR